MLDLTQFTLYSGGHAGAEAAFGDLSEKWGIKEVNFVYKNQNICRDKSTVLLPEDELEKGDVSMEIVSRHMGRNYTETERIRSILRTIYHMVTNADHIFAIGWILANDTVKGGTGWGVELAKFFNRPVSVYDQEREHWFTWKDKKWLQDNPEIYHNKFAGTGTRNLTENGKQAILDLFIKSFGEH